MQYFVGVDLSSLLEIGMKIRRSERLFLFLISAIIPPQILLPRTLPLLISLFANRLCRKKRDNRNELSNTPKGPEEAFSNRKRNFISMQELYKEYADIYFQVMSNFN